MTTHLASLSVSAISQGDFCLWRADENRLLSSTELYQFTVPESALILSVVAKIKAVDLDLGQNAEMDYKILDGDEVGTFGIITDPDTQEGLIILHTVLVHPAAHLG